MVSCLYALGKSTAEEMEGKKVLFRSVLREKFFDRFPHNDTIRRNEPPEVARYIASSEEKMLSWLVQFVLAIQRRNLCPECSTMGYPMFSSSRHSIHLLV